MFYFNHLKELLLRVTMNLVLSKVLCLKFVNKKIMERRDFNKIVKKLVIFIKIFCSKTLIRYSYTFTYIYRKKYMQSKTLIIFNKPSNNPHT